MPKENTVDYFVLKILHNQLEDALFKEYPVNVCAQ